MTDYKVEVDKLRKEIVHLKADKDFVWSLWKRLQLSSPDLTEAVSIISQRERDKIAREHVDVGKTMAEKEERLRELEAVVAARNGEIESLTLRNKEVSVRATQFERQCADLADKATKLDEMMTAMEQRDGDCQRQVIDEYERERQQLSETVSRLQTTITSLVAQRAELQLQTVRHDELLCDQQQMRAAVDAMRAELATANAHIGTQQQTIAVLRDHIEQQMAPADEDGDGDRSEDAPQPIVDLHYKMDRLGLHLQQLQRCVGAREGRQSVQRSRSTPPRKAHKDTMQRDELCRKIDFLSHKLATVERQLSDEKSVAASSTDCLDKANKRWTTAQLTVKQLRQQLDDTRCQQNEWRISVNRLETEVCALRKEIKAREMDKQRMVENSVNDADRIQELLSKMENMRDELTEKRVRQSEESGAEMQRLRQLVQQLETEKCSMDRLSHANMARSESTSYPLQAPSRQYCASTRVKKPKLNIGTGKDSRSRQTSNKNNRKTKNMCAILNHFSGDSDIQNGMATGKEDEWEDVDSDEESEETSRITGDTCTERTSEPVTSTSTGTIVARVAAINQCCDKGDSMTSKRKSEAKRSHIARMQKTIEKSVAETEATVAKSRVASLEQQLRSLIVSRDDYRTKCQSLQSQVKTLSDELSQAKSRSTRLAEAIKKQSCQYQLMLEKRRQFPADGMAPERPHSSEITTSKEMGSDMDDLDPILQSCRGEVSAGMTMCRELQKELGRKDADLVQLKDKLSKADRENSVKKRIIDDLKAKMSPLDEAKDKEKKVLEGKDRKIKELEDSQFKMKTHIDSLQTRLNVVLEERRRFEQESASLISKLEVSETRLAELRHAKQSVENRLSKIDESHENRMTDVIARSGSALDKASLQIQNLKMRGGKYEGLVVNLARDLYRKIREIRRLLEYGQRTFNRLEASGSGHSHIPSAAFATAMTMATGYEFARNKAAAILSLAPEDIDELLNGSPSASARGRKTQRGTQANNNCLVENECDAFPQKCRDAFKDRTFDDIIQGLFAEKLEELVDLVATPSSRSTAADDSGCASSS